MPSRSSPWGGVLPSWGKGTSPRNGPAVMATDYYLLQLFQAGSIKKALNNREGPQGLGTWLRALEHMLYCSLLNCQWSFHILTPHLLFKASFQWPSEVQRNGFSCSHMQHRVILPSIK